MPLPFWVMAPLATRVGSTEGEVSFLFGLQVRIFTPRRFNV